MPESDIARFLLILVIVLLTFAFLFKLLDCWADSIKERKRLNSIIERTDEISDDSQNNSQGDGEIRH